MKRQEPLSGTTAGDLLLATFIRWAWLMADREVMGSAAYSIDVRALDEPGTIVQVPIGEIGLWYYDKNGALRKREPKKSWLQRIVERLRGRDL